MMGGVCLNDEEKGQISVFAMVRADHPAGAAGSPQ